MLTTAAKGAAGAGWAAKAAMTACVLLLAACGDKPAADGAATAPGQTEAAIPQPGAQPGGNRTDGAAQVSSAAPISASALDTSTWILPPPFYAGGEEPFWKLDIVDGWFVLRRSGLPEIEAPMVQPTKVGGADVFDTSPLKLTIKRGACQTDEGSQGDIIAEVVFDDVTYDGCAIGGQASAASAEAATVLESLAPIDACLEKLGEPAVVTAVYPREEGKTAVALRSKDGSLYECAVETDGKTIAFLDPIEQRSAGAWMTRMRFLRTGVADATKCADAEEVKAGDKTAGRLLSKACKF